jgi:CRISPR-associated protein Cas5h
MEAISFILSGQTAHFKKPDVNSYAYFTYNNIHKPALLGLLGAIIGLSGYTQLYNKINELEQELSNLKGKAKKELQQKINLEGTLFPEFYDKLKDLKISIKPLSQNGYFNKKIQVFNNSVGYANGMVSGKKKEALKERKNSSNLIIREQWLENPKWQILLLDDDSIDKNLFDKLKDYLLNSKTEFIPYLGKNDHPAKIQSIKVIQLEKIENQFYNKISSLFIKDRFELSVYPPRGEMLFLHKEFLPVTLKEKYHLYELIPFVYTNSKATSKSDLNLILSYNNENYFFF